MNEPYLLSYFLKNIALSSMAMLSKRTTAALFAILIASSLIVLSGGLVGLALAKKVKKQDDAYGTVPAALSLGKSLAPAVLRNDSPRSHSATADNPSENTGDISLDISAKEFLKSLSKCESRAAADGDLTQAEVTDCFHQIKADQQ
ncbi:MAG: hypothetical protein ACJ72Q_16255 [Nitrososphaeraceae archaeon]